MKHFVSDSHAAIEALWRLTKSILRRRKRIDGLLEESMEAYKAAAHTAIPGLAENASWAFEDGGEPHRILAAIEDLEDPANRLRTKRWCTVQIVLETIAEWATNIRRSLAGPSAQVRAATREVEPRGPNSQAQLG
jgi:hypothetical protein